MSNFEHRERVLKALNHEEPDRVPIDLGSSAATTITSIAYEKLKTHLGFEHQTTAMMERSGTVILDEAICQMFDIDTRPLLLGKYRSAKLRRLDPYTSIDEWGVSWKMTSHGTAIDVNGPFYNKDPKPELLETFDWPDPNNSGLYYDLKERARHLRTSTDCAIVLNLPVGVVHQSQFLRGFDTFLIDLYTATEFSCYMMDKIADIWIKIAEIAIEEAEGNFDVVIWYDDLGLQQALLVSPQMYRDLIKPRHKKMVAALKSLCQAKILLHTCGSVYDILDDLIEIGIDALNPVQVSAKNMEPEQLKTRFGDRLTFWGAIDTQEVLPFRKPQDVREEVRRIIDAMGDNGGYVISSVQNIQADVPPENIVAMLQEAKAYGTYKK